MRKLLSLVAAMLLGLLIAGCDPEPFLVWSPDGQRGAVIAVTGLHLTDADGTLSKLLIPNARKVAWLNDNRRALVLVQLQDPTWGDVGPRLSDEQRKDLDTRAAAFLAMAQAEKGKLEPVMKKFIESQGGLAEDVLPPLGLLLRDRHGEVLAKRFGEEWQQARSTDITAMALRIYDLDENPPKPGPILGLVFSILVDLRPSPDGSSAAFTVAYGNKIDLHLVPTDGSKPAHRIAEDVSRYADWSADGKSLLYIKATSLAQGASNDQARLGTLRQMRLVDDAGAPLKQLPVDQPRKVVQEDGSTSVEASPASSLCHLAFTHSGRVRALRDGRIMFSALDVSFPATDNDLVERPMLYILEPARHPAISRAVARRVEWQLPEGTDYFELSPDQSKAALLGSGGRMVLLDLVNGDLSEINPANGKDRPAVLPAWRTNEQLTFAVPNTGDLAKQRPGEYMIWNAQTGAKKLSETWGNEAVAPLKAQ